MTKQLMAFILAGCIAGAAATSEVLAAPIDLVAYTFPVTNNGKTGVGYGPTDTATGIEASDISDTSGALGMRIENLGYVTAPVLTVDPNGTTAFNENVYFGFTVTAEDDLVLALESLTLQAARGGGSARGFVIRSSVDGYANDLAITPDATAIPTARPELTSFTVDLSDPAFSNLSEITFRIHPFSNGATLTIDFDNITLVGEVIPEPASLSLLALGSLGLLRRRRATAAAGW